MSSREETLGQTLERLQFSRGLGTPQRPPGGAGRSGRREVNLEITTESVPPLIGKGEEDEDKFQNHTQIKN